MNGVNGAEKIWFQVHREGHVVQLTRALSNPSFESRRLFDTPSDE